MFDPWPLMCRLGLAGLVAAALGTAPRAAEELHFTHQGMQRSVRLYQPSSLPPGPRPLIVALHGQNQPVDGLRSWLRLETAADREGFVTAYPTAIDLKWSYGRPINQPMPAVEDRPVDDLGFIQLLIDGLVSKKLADPARVYVTGVSRGGLMAFTLACQLADRIAAVAPLITGMTEFQLEECRPSRPVPIMVIAGTADRVQSFGGGQGLRGRLLSVPQTMNFWRLLHGCEGRADRALPHLNQDDPTRVMLVEWSSCRTNASPRLYRIDGGGHQPPSIAVRASPDSEQRMGLRNRDIETADELWEFFKNHSR